MKNHSPKTEFAYPVEKIHGKISRHSKVVHACTAAGESITYLQGQRNFAAHPVTDGEVARHDLFTRQTKAAAARISSKSPTYADDMAAYREQYETGYKTFRAYIWSIIKAEITE